MLKLHLGRFLTKEGGGIGGLEGSLNLGWTGVKEDVEEVVEEEEDEESPGWMRHGKVSPAEEADMRGYMLPEERGGVRIGVAWVEEADDTEYEEASSGKGYSNFVESVAKGVPTI